MGVEIEYSMLGVPQVSGGVEVSVSHCRGMVAVLFSEERCGVDVELLERDFERTAKRWISGPERALSDNKNFLAIVWSAKEAMYKLLGRSWGFVVNLNINHRHHYTLLLHATIGHAQLTHKFATSMFKIDHIV